jgi:hypothetical protein
VGAQSCSVKSFVVELLQVVDVVTPEIGWSKGVIVAKCDFHCVYTNCLDDLVSIIRLCFVDTYEQAQREAA